MVDLKKDLDEYLLLQSDQKKTFKLQMPPIIQKSPDWFKKDTGESWFKASKPESCLSLSRMQRFVLFGICVGVGILCFSISLMYIPILLFKTRKFALLFTVGSIFFEMSFFFLWGPRDFLKLMFAKERLILTLTYGGTLVITLYCALYLQNTLLTVVFAVCQMLSLIWNVIISVPGGSSGILFFTKIFSRSVGKTLPV